MPARADADPSRCVQVAYIPTTHASHVSVSLGDLYNAPCQWIYENCIDVHDDFVVDDLTSLMDHEFSRGRFLHMRLSR